MVDKSKSKNFRSFETGERVLALNLREGDKWLKGTIIQKLGVNVYSVHIDSLNTIWKRHVNQLLENNIVSSDFDRDRNVAVVPRVPQPIVNPVSSSSNSQLVEINESNNNPHLTEQILNRNEDVGEHTDLVLAEAALPTLRRSERIRKPVERYGFD